MKFSCITPQERDLSLTINKFCVFTESLLQPLNFSNVA